MKDEERARRIIARDFSARLLNNTKWDRLLDSLREVTISHSYRIKFVDVTEVLEGSLRPATEKYFDSLWGPVPKLAVEWFEIDPVQIKPRGALLKPETIDHSVEIEGRLKELNVEYQRQGAAIRVVALVRSSR
ncbi:MAG: hypothetical protein IPH08_10440 [Rhodocyclaceae bacterium]|nr:hypothetical protein [Rhodocyclaceae bacterium]